MTQYIDKVTIETELQRRLKSHKEEIEKYSPFHHNLVIDIIGKKEECKDILSFLDTLEVKEVDLEKEINSWIEDNSYKGELRADVREAAEYFFELGLKTKGG